MPEIVSFWRLDASEIDGRFMRADDVIAWAKRIRAAVAAERGAMFLHVTGRGKDAPARLAESILACEALDALLTDGG